MSRVYRNIYILLNGDNIWSTDPDAPKLYYSGDVYERSIYGDKISEPQFFIDRDYDPEIDFSIGCGCVSHRYSGYQKAKGVVGPAGESEEEKRGAARELEQEHIDGEEEYFHERTRRKDEIDDDTYRKMKYGE